VAKPTAVIFDNDGLLLDTESVWSRAESELFARRGREFTLAHKQQLVGTSAEINGRLLAGFLDEPGGEVQLISELDELVLAELEGGVDPMVGAVELLGLLREMEIPVAVVSNSPLRFLTRALEIVGLDTAFGVVVSGHEVPAPKPEPDPYLEAARQLGVTPGPDVIVLEDSPTGVAAGRAAGMTVIGVPSLPGVELDEAHEIMSSLADPRVLERLGLT
jgi:HAD superfamily hydrolase (TIGR01509 family)